MFLPGGEPRPMRDSPRKEPSHPLRPFADPAFSMCARESLDREERRGHKCMAHRETYLQIDEPLLLSIICLSSIDPIRSLCLHVQGLEASSMNWKNMSTTEAQCSRCARLGVSGLFHLRMRVCEVGLDSAESSRAGLVGVNSGWMPTRSRCLRSMCRPSSCRFSKIA